MTECPGYTSHGREPWVYPAKHPRELQGVHAQLIAARLRPADQLRYLLYSPIWPGAEAPFGLHSWPASHGLAVTQDRFILSRNEHDAATPPVVVEIPFEHILCIEIGSALLLGWIVFRYAQENAAATVVLFCSATGLEYFAAAMRQYRTACRTQQNPPARQPAGTVKRVNGWPADLVRGLENLLLPDESSHAAFFAPGEWGQQIKYWRKQYVCFSAPCLMLKTDAGLLYALGEEAMRPDFLSFGVNTVGVSADALEGITVAEDANRKEPALCLRIHLRRGAVGFTQTVALGAQTHEVARRFAGAANPAEARR